MAKEKNSLSLSYTQNRELSWLRFNQRVLEEAFDATVPLYEKLKFIAIFTSNLDEFFMIRVGSLHDLSLLKKPPIDNKSGMIPAEQLVAIAQATAPLYQEKDKLFAQVETELRQWDICNLTLEECTNNEKKFIERYFQNYILPVLSPQIVDIQHPFPHLSNKSLNVVLMLQDKNNTLFGVIPLPQSLPRCIFLPGSSLRYILLEKVLLAYADQVFDMYKVLEKTVIAITRNADISPEDEGFEVDEDYRMHMKKLLKKRARLAPVRLEAENNFPPLLREYLMKRLDIAKSDIYTSKTPLDLSYVYTLESKFDLTTSRSITYPVFEPQIPAMVNQQESMIKQALRKDIFLSYPYEQMDPFLRLLKEAAEDPNVLSIKITIYRLAKKAKLIEYLTNAAENNKDVTVLMELRARFDEQNNIDWSETLEEAGCTVLYGFEGFKVHSKICLITRREKNHIQYITQVGTGNYNEKTAKLYTDFSLITSDSAIGNDAATFFKNMAVANLDGQYDSLLVAPHSLKPYLLGYIAKEIAKGKDGRILIKMNSLTDRQIIDKLAEASQAGVKIRLIVRGICCLLPGVAGTTENITVQSIVGRFLEHSRVYCFGQGNDTIMYISSADLMTRNTEKRVELACPVWDNDIKGRILQMLEIMLQDTVKGRKLLNDGQYTKIEPQGEPINSQEYFMLEAYRQAHHPQSAAAPKRSLGERIRQLFLTKTINK